MNANKKFRKAFGFTLIEVLVSATIIAVLTAAAAVSYSSVNKRSRDARRKSDIEQLRAALEQYRSDNGYYVYIYSPQYIARLQKKIQTYKRDTHGSLFTVLSGIIARRAFAVDPPPVTWDSIDTALSTLVTSGYIASMPTDPAGGNYYFKGTYLNADTHYYGYCLCAMLDTIASGVTDSNCSEDDALLRLPAACNYGRRNP